ERGAVRLFQIGRDGVGADTILAQCVRRGGKLLRAPRSEGHAGAGEPERPRQGEADSGIAAGDQRRAALEIEQMRQTRHQTSTGSPMSKLWPAKYLRMR